MPAILIEPLFVGNTGDVAKYTPEKLALAIAKGIDSNIITEIKNNEFKKEMNYSMYVFSKNWYLKRYSFDRIVMTYFPWFIKSPTKIMM